MSRSPSFSTKKIHQHRAIGCGHQAIIVGQDSRQVAEMKSVPVPTSTSMLTAIFQVSQFALGSLLPLVPEKNLWG